MLIDAVPDLNQLALPDLGHAEAMAQWLSSRGIRLFDYTQWTQPLREELRRNPEGLSAATGLIIREYFVQPTLVRNAL